MLYEQERPTGGGRQPGWTLVDLMKRETDFLQSRDPGVTVGD